MRMGDSRKIKNNELEGAGETWRTLHVHFSCNRVQQLQPPLTNFHVLSNRFETHVLFSNPHHFINLFYALFSIVIFFLFLCLWPNFSLYFIILELKHGKEKPCLAWRWRRITVLQETL